MKLTVMLLFLLYFVECSVENILVNSSCPNVKSSLASVRKRRHLAFPKGSTVAVITSAVKTFMTHAPSGWFVTVEAELTYKLPDEEFVSAHMRRKLHHRQKKEIWETLHSVLDERNMDGRACILRAVCEAQRYLAPKGLSLVHDILRVLFIPHSHEEEFVQQMGVTYAEIFDQKFCDRPTDCPFSILGMILDINTPR